MNNRTKGLCLAAIGALLWGASGVAAQYLFHQKGFSPEFLVVIRLLTSGCLLLGIDGLLNFGDIFTIWHFSGVVQKTVNINNGHANHGASLCSV